MIFSQLEFIFFFIFVFLLLWLIRSLKWKKILLLAASYYFYAYWDWRFLFLLAACTVINWLCGIGIERTNSAAAKKTYLGISVIYSLSILGVCKYYNFFISSLKPVFDMFNWHAGTLNIILPVGISFFTFQCLSYSIDVYRKKIINLPSLSDFSLYVAFFPQLVAGPIVRAADFLPQLEKDVKPTSYDILCGLRQFVFGFFKKVFIADRVAIFVDTIFEGSGIYSGTTLWLAAIVYAIQIFCDFSGYSDMAIGLARMMGYHFNINFDSPYISLNITEFWRRWHISLSSWLKDYLYISLGGSRKGNIRTYANLLITMVLGGLWHGASWNFIFWGAWHGCWLAAHKIFMTLGIKFNHRAAKALWNILSWAATFMIVLIGWIFFRAATFRDSVNYIKRMFTLPDGITWHEPFVIGIVAAMVMHHICIYFNIGSKLRTPKSGTFLYWYLLTLMTLTAIVFKRTEFQPFIYFQF